jgi:FlaA1/EpsC-like NDP-sugar epimerase
MAIIPTLHQSRARIAYVHDVCMAAISFPLSLYLRVGGEIEYFITSFLTEGMFIFTSVAAGVFWFANMHRGVWRYASLNDLIPGDPNFSTAALPYITFAGRAAVTSANQLVCPAHPAWRTAIFVSDIQKPAA